ncbi:hypothetical protein GGF42_001925 [Coemansia sp. RSA 2424]|nr:hypothetical protein GGF42_001925 [Coemansia sp. RSA 2424]
MARNTSTGDDKSLSATTYRSAVVQALHTLTALALWSLLEDKHSQSTLHDLSLVWDSDGEEEGAAIKGSALLLCQALRRLLPDSEEFLGVSFSALQTLSSILGVRPHLIARDVAQLRLPHLHVREHSPRSTEALMHLAVQNGLGRLMLEPAIVGRFIQHVCDGSMLRSSMMLRSMQMWLDMTGNVVRHSLFRSHLGMFASSAAVTGDVGAGLDFSTWWSLALAASARCLIDVAALGNDADARMIRLACAMPSHFLSWQAYLPASDISVSRLLDSRRIDGSNIRASSIRQLHSRLVSFSPPDITSAPTSIMYPVYFLACKLWLDNKLFDRSSGCDDHLALQISRDMWGIASDALQFLWRLITQPTLRRVFVNFGLVDDFASSVLVKLVSRQGFSDSISRCLRKREQAESPRSEERQLSGDTSDLVTIPLVESMNDKFELEYRSDSGGLESPSQPQPPLSARDLVGRLLDDISHSHKTGGGHSGGSSSRLPRRSAAEYYSEPMLGQLWYKFIDRLLQLPATIAFGRISTAADTAVLRPTPADRRGELSEWLDDSDGVLFGLCEPLLTVRGPLAQPSTMWDVMASAIPAGDILFTIREAAAAAKEGASLRMCISAAFLLPELDNSSSSATAAEPLRTDVETVGPMLLEPLIRGLVGSSNDDDSQRCLVALLFMAWRQRRRISDQVAKCAWQLKSDVVAMRDDLASCGPHLAAFSITDLAEHIDAVGDLVLLSGHRKGLLEDNQTAVAASATLLARHSRVLEAMLAGSFAEAQTQSGAARRVSLQCDHEALTGMLDIYHRCLSTFSCSASSLSRKTMASAVEGLRAELERDFSHDEMAAVLELAAFYGLRPVVALLAWVFSAGFSAVKVSAYSADTLDRLVLMHGDNLSGYQSSSEPLAIRRVLAAVLLLCLDQIDSASVVGDATDSFVSSALFLLYREQ